MNSIFGNSMLMTERSLDFLWAKQNITQNNIANNDTPGFKAQYVSFEDNLKSNLRKSGKRQSATENRKAIEASRIAVHDTKNETARLDGNNVQVDVEEVELARTALQYQFQLQSFNGDATRLRTVIKGQ